MHFMKPEGSLPHSQQPAHVPILSQISPVQGPIRFLEAPF